MTEPNTQETFNPGAAAAQRRLYRSVSDRKLAGVCGGVAEYFGIDTVLVRVLWVMGCFFGLFGVLAYIVAWAVVPDNPLGAAAPPMPRQASNTSRYVLGTILIVLGVVWLAERHGFDFLVPWHWDEYFIPHWMSWGLVFAVVLIVLGVMLVVRGTGRNTTPTAVNTLEAPLANFATTGESHMKQKILTRSLNDRMIGGVCGGMAEYFSVDPSLVRVGWVMLTFFSGFFLGIIAYIVLMVVVPEQKPEANHTAPSTGAN